MVEATWRIRRSEKLSLLACLPVFLAWGALGLWLTLTEKTILSPLAAGTMMAGLPFVMAGLTVVTLLAYERRVWTIRDGSVAFRGLFRRWQIEMGEVTSAKWPAKVYRETLSLRAGAAQVVIPFGLFEPDERERLIAYFRSSLATEIQVGWNLFAYGDELANEAAARTKPGPDEVLIRRSRYDRFLLPCLVAFCVVGAIGWTITGNAGQLLAGPVATLLLWGVLRTSVPARGQIQARLSFRPDSENAGRVGFLLVWGAIGLAILFGVDALRDRLKYPDATMISVAVVWFVVLLWEMVRQDRGESRRLRERADLAAKLRGEPCPETRRGR